MLTEIPGITVGHWTDEQARTGCTVVRFPEGTVASGEVRGGAPATREFALLDPTMLVQRLDAVVLSGGSAFGLAAADGVMVQLEDEGVEGVDVVARRVRIMSTLVKRSRGAFGALLDDRGRPNRAILAALFGVSDLVEEADKDR